MQDQTVTDLAQRYGVSPDAVRVLWRAFQSGGGRAAQFSHPDLGGMGQWAGGMIMIGDMFNNGLKDRVSRLCSELAGMPMEPVVASGGRGMNWWPDGLGTPSSTGSQNSMRYACFPDTRRLAIEQDGRLTIYDTGAHHLSGFSQSPKHVAGSDVHQSGRTSAGLRSECRSCLTDKKVFWFFFSKKNFFLRDGLGLSAAFCPGDW